MEIIIEDETSAEKFISIIFPREKQTLVELAKKSGVSLMEMSTDIKLILFNWCAPIKGNEREQRFLNILTEYYAANGLITS